MQTPVPLHVLQRVRPEPRNRPVPLQVLQRPDPRQEEQTEGLPEDPPSEWVPLGMTHPDNSSKSTASPPTITRIDFISSIQN